MALRALYQEFLGTAQELQTLRRTLAPDNLLVENIADALSSL